MDSFEGLLSLLPSLVHVIYHPKRTSPSHIDFCSGVSRSRTHVGLNCPVFPFYGRFAAPGLQQFTKTQTLSFRSSNSAKNPPTPPKQPIFTFDGVI
jgi:hypothetical protein